MRHSSGLNNDLADEQVEVFRVLYPIFKDEVFQRREQMMRLTAFASAFLVMLLITILALSPLPRTDFSYSMVCEFQAWRCFPVYSPT